MIVWLSIYDHFRIDAWAHQVWQLNSRLQLSEGHQIHSHTKADTKAEEQDCIERVICTDVVLYSLISCCCVRVIDSKRQIKDEGAADANQKPLPSFGKYQEYHRQCEDTQAEYLGPKSKFKVNGCTHLVVIFVGYCDCSLGLVLAVVGYGLFEQTKQLQNLWFEQKDFLVIHCGY